MFYFFCYTPGSFSSQHPAQAIASSLHRALFNMICFLSLYYDDCQLTHMDFIGFKDNLPKRSDEFQLEC